MTIEENAKLATLLNIILKSTKMIQDDFKDDIENTQQTLLTIFMKI